MTLWWISRGTGLAALVALTAGLALGVATVPRVARPRFVTAGLHRTLTVGALALVVAHVGTVVLDGYAPVGWLDAVLPFRSPYRELWTGLGTVAFDVLVVAALTSWRRLRPPYAAWRAIHLVSWACWPVAVAHGVAAGSDTKARWALGLTALCVAGVAGALGWRVAGSGAAVAPAALAGVALLVGLSLAGPLQRGWATRSGTPIHLIAAAGTGSAPAAWLRTLTGSARQGLTVGGSLLERQETGVSDVRAREVLLSSVPGGMLQLVLEGPAFETGIDLRGSAVTLGPAADPTFLRGEVTRVDGSGYILRLRAAGQPQLDLRLAVTLFGATSWHGELTLGTHRS